MSASSSGTPTTQTVIPGAPIQIQRAPAQAGATDWLRHRFEMFPVTPFARATSLETGWFWHNELDSVYYQVCYSHASVLQPVIEMNFDVYLRIDNEPDTDPYASFVRNFNALVIPWPGPPDHYARTFPIGGNEMLGSIEFKIIMTPTLALPIDSELYIQLWAAPERWFTLRCGTAETWPNPAPPP